MKSTKFAAFLALSLLAGAQQLRPANAQAQATPPAEQDDIEVRGKWPVAPPWAVRSRPAKTGPRSALNVKFRKLTTPVAVPLTEGGLASLMTV